jgi:hypothetical protein
MMRVAAVRSISFEFFLAMVAGATVRPKLQKFGCNPDKFSHPQTVFGNTVIFASKAI